VDKKPLLIATKTTPDTCRNRLNVIASSVVISKLAVTKSTFKVQSLAKLASPLCATAGIFTRFQTGILSQTNQI